MVEQENALYEGKPWCVYELKDEYGIYKDEIRLFMRMESQKRNLICPECGKPLILCAGPIREPYLKHYDRSECAIRTNGNGNTARMARACLYQLAKRSYPEAEILCNYTNGPYLTDIYVRTEKGQIALEYLSSDCKLEDWAKKHSFYEQSGITDLWFLNGTRYGKEKHTTFEYLVSRAKREYMVFDVKAQILKIKELYLAYPEQSVHPISKEYALNELKLLEDGRFDCDFYKIRDQYVAELLRERKITEVERRTEGDGICYSNTFPLTSICEWWDLPGLLGEEDEVRKAREKRNQYLKAVNVRLEYQDDIDGKMNILKEALRIVNFRRKALQWI